MYWLHGVVCVCDLNERKEKERKGEEEKGKERRGERREGKWSEGKERKCKVRKRKEKRKGKRHYTLNYIVNLSVGRETASTNSNVKVNKNINEQYATMCWSSSEQTQTDLQLPAKNYLVTHSFWYTEASREIQLILLYLSAVSPGSQNREK